MFDLFLSKSCHGWPGPGVASDHVYTMNPAKEFVDNHEAHVRSASKTSMMTRFVMSIMKIKKGEMIIIDCT